MIRVFVLDDHEIVRKGLRYLIEAQPDMRVVGEAATAAEGRSLLDRSTTTRVLDRLRESEQHDRRLEVLTTRESAVLELIGQGLTNREIADRIYLAEKTVKNYVSSLLAKIQVHGRTQAALYIAEQQRVHPPARAEGGARRD